MINTHKSSDGNLVLHIEVDKKCDAEQKMFKKILEVLFE